MAPEEVPIPINPFAPQPFSPPRWPSAPPIPPPPKMDGVELLRHIRMTHRDLPVVLYTAYGEYKGDFATWASDASVTKSADLTELTDTIRKLLAAHRGPPG